MSIYNYADIYKVFCIRRYFVKLELEICNVLLHIVFTNSYNFCHVVDRQSQKICTQKEKKSLNIFCRFCNNLLGLFSLI